MERNLRAASQFLRENECVELYAQIVETEEKVTAMEIEIASLKTLLEKSEIEIGDLIEECEGLLLIFNAKKKVVKHPEQDYYMLPDAHRDFKFCPVCWEAERYLSILYDYSENDPADTVSPLTCFRCSCNI